MDSCRDNGYFDIRHFIDSNDLSNEFPIPSSPTKAGIVVEFILMLIYNFFVANGDTNQNHLVDSYQVYIRKNFQLIDFCYILSPFIPCPEVHNVMHYIVDINNVFYKRVGNLPGIGRSIFYIQAKFTENMDKVLSTTDFRYYKKNDRTKVMSITQFAATIQSLEQGSVMAMTNAVGVNLLDDNIESFCGPDFTAVFKKWKDQSMDYYDRKMRQLVEYMRKTKLGSKCKGYHIQNIIPKETTEESPLKIYNCPKDLKNEYKNLVQEDVRVEDAAVETIGNFVKNIKLGATSCKRPKHV